MIVLGILYLIVLSGIIIGLISWILPSKEKWAQLKKETEARRNKK